MPGRVWNTRRLAFIKLPAGTGRAHLVPFRLTPRHVKTPGTSESTPIAWKDDDPQPGSIGFDLIFPALGPAGPSQSSLLRSGDTYHVLCMLCIAQQTRERSGRDANQRVPLRCTIGGHDAHPRNFRGCVTGCACGSRHLNTITMGKQQYTTNLISSHTKSCVGYVADANLAGCTPDLRE